VGSHYLMLRERRAQRNRNALVEQNTHLCRGQCTARGVLQDGANLLQRDAGKPLHKLRYQSAVFEILKQRRDWHASAAEHPSSADPFGVVLNGGTSGPVDHGGMLSPWP